MQLSRHTLTSFAVLLLLGACKDDGLPLMFVTTKLGATELQGHVFTLRVSIEGGATTASRDYGRDNGAAIAFPSTFSLTADKAYGNTINLTVQGLDAARRAVGQAELKAIVLRTGKTTQQEIFLSCLGRCPSPTTDAGAGEDGPQPPADMLNCGNGRLNPGETCDIAIATSQPGSCPANECNDGLACTRDQKMGSACNVQCVYQEILAFLPGDGCCPAGGTHETDEDCSPTCGNGTVDPQEACDKSISDGIPGSCPSVVVCNDGTECTSDRLISANTCAARCTHQAIDTPTTGDSCCPANATAAVDGDCAVVCGNGLVEPGETCDTGIPVGKSGACPTTCNDDKPCTSDITAGAGCQKTCTHGEVSTRGKSDGCCPAKAGAAADPDCLATCGNGVVEPAETCDKGIPADQPGGCPKTCSAVGCQPQVFKGAEATCTAVCELGDAAACILTTKDACCSSGCTSASDADCSSTCGNGLVEANEVCDKAIASLTAGACPATCDDNNPCTVDRWDSKGTCLDQCVSTPVTVFKSGDLCCPPGANRSVDSDCPATCGNNVVEAEESCDRAIAAGQPGACLSACLPSSACAMAKLTGSPLQCTATCEVTAVTACLSGDGCCPPACGANQDADCPVVCGNGLVERGEACDKGITAGFPGACFATCENSESCTRVIATGSVENCSRRCSAFRNLACASGDGCCPVGCSFRTDLDCAPICGNGVVEDGETCDPATNCPTSCQADADLCTAAKLVGDPAACTARCAQTPIVECGATADQCCPSGCSMAGSDPDCKPAKAAATNQSRLL